MTGYKSKRAAARDKLEDDDALTIAYQSGYYDGKKAAQPAQEPVAHFGSAYINENGVHITTVLGPVAIPQDAKLYTTPPQRPWVGLTDEEQQQAYEQWQNEGWGVFYKAIEAKLKEKNT